MPTTYRASKMALLSKRRLVASSEHTPPLLSPPPSRLQESHYYIAATAASKNSMASEMKSDKSHAQKQSLSLSIATRNRRMLWFITASIQCLLLLQFIASSASTKDGEQLAQCCTKMLANSAKAVASDFCRGALALNAADKAELRSAFGCSSDAPMAAMEKRKPNFMRYGRSPFGSSADPNFLRFGRATVAATDALPFTDLLAIAEKKSNGVSANFLRFGKSASDPNFLRFGKRASALSSPLLGSDSAEPNFLRFGKRVPISTFYGGDDIMAEKFDQVRREKCPLKSLGLAKNAAKNVHRFLKN